MRHRSSVMLGLTAALFLAVAPGIADNSRAFDIPKVGGLVVDGVGDDWGEAGFRVEVLADPEGRTLAPGDFNVLFRLAWNEKGLAVLSVVRDDTAVEQEDVSRLWRSDCLELFVSERLGSNNRYQVVIAPGADPRLQQVRHKIYDWRPEEDRIPELAAQSASRIHDGGWVVEALLPWTNLGIRPGIGMELAFQFAANDDDGPAEAGSANGSLRLAWFPGLEPSDRFGMHRLRLSDRHGEAVTCRVDRTISPGSCVVSVLGGLGLFGQSVTLRSGGTLVARGEFRTVNGRPRAEFLLDPASYPGEWPALEVLAGEKTVALFEALPTLERLLDGYVSALGGREALEKLDTRVCPGHLVDELNRTDPQVVSRAFHAWAKAPDLWLMSLNHSEGTEENGFDGRVGWKVSPDRIERDDRMGRSWLGFVLNPRGPLHIQKYFPGMTLEAKTMIAGRPVYQVKNTSANILYFDAQTGLLSRIGSFYELEDYRPTDGVLVPHRIVISRKGGRSVFAFETIEHNVPVDDGLFGMPEADEVFPEVFDGLEDADVLPLLKMKNLAAEHGEMNIPCRDGRFLYDFILEKGYRRGLEIGTFNGYSTLWLGLAFRRTGGRVVTIEFDKVSGGQARRNFEKAGMDDVIDLRIADAFEEIPKIAGDFDFVFIDAWKPDYVRFLRLVRDRIRPGGAIVAHNVTNYAEDMKDYLDAISKDNGLETTFHQTSAEGFAVSLIKPK